MLKLIKPLALLTVVLAGLSIWVHSFSSDSSAASDAVGETVGYQPELAHDPPVPEPPEASVQDFNTFLQRLKVASEKSLSSLLLNDRSLERAEEVFFATVGVPEDVMLELHAPFFTVNPEAIFALYHDLPTLERGLGLYQQNCSQCHGPYGRGNGAATTQWYLGNFPRNFWYGKFKSRSTEYGTAPTDSDLFRTLTRGLYGSTMPPFRHLSVEDRWALVQFIKTLANFYDDYDEIVINRFDPAADAEPIPLDLSDQPSLTLETVSRGRVLFLKQGCATCHQGNKPKPVGLSRWEGSFDTWNDEMNRPIQSSRDLTSPIYLSGSAPSDLFRIISGGPNIGPMPNYGTISQEDRWALVHYIQSVFSPDLPQAPPSVDALAKPPGSD